jgi:hypothetical protein
LAILSTVLIDNRVGQFQLFSSRTMWRAFFYASGIMLIILGLECIVIGRFVISKESAIARVTRKFIGNEGSFSGSPPVNSQANGYGSAQSQFGPTRFSDNPFSMASNDRTQGNPFNLASQRTGTSLTAGAVQGRNFTTEDWMPWSLIAAGAIVTLYTHSLGPAYQSQ